MTGDVAGSVIVEELQEHSKIIARNIGTESFEDSVSLMKLCRPVSRNTLLVSGYLAVYLGFQS